MTLILISFFINIALIIFALEDQSMETNNWQNILGGSSGSRRSVQSIPSSYVHLSQADSIYSWQQLVTSPSHIQLIQQQQPPPIQYFQVQKPTRTQYSTQNQIFNSNKQFSNYQYVHQYNIGGGPASVSIAPDRLYYQHHSSCNQLCQPRYHILQKGHMVNPTKAASLTTCFKLTNSNIEGLNTSESLTPAYDQVSVPPLTPTFHEMPPYSFVNPLDAVPDILKDDRPGASSFRSTPTLFVVSQANFSYHSCTKKYKKNHRTQNRQIFIEFNNSTKGNSHVLASTIKKIRFSNQKTYADVVQDIKPRSNNFRKMSKAQGVSQRMEHEDLEDESESTTSLMSSTTNETLEFSSPDSGKSTWQLTSSSSSSHHGDDEETEAVKVKKSKLHRRQRISKMAQNFCFGELEKNVGFFWLWDQYSKNRRRLSYTERLQENQFIQNSNKENHIHSNGLDKFHCTLELQQKDENSNVSHENNESTNNDTYSWKSNNTYFNQKNI